MEEKRNQKFDKLEEWIKLGTLDNTILTTMIFLFVLGVSILQIGIKTLLQINPLLAVMFLYYIILMVPISYSIFGYIPSILIKNNRFNTKKMVLTFLLGTGIFVIGMWVLIIIFGLLENNGSIIPKEIIIGISFFWLLIIVLISLTKIKNRIWIYFKKEFPLILQEREKEIERERNFKKKEKMRTFKIPKYLTLLLTISIIFLIFGGCLIWVSANISEYPTFENYRYSFSFLNEGGGSVNLRDAQFSYRFEDKRAHLGFKPTESLKKIIIHIPKEIEGEVEVIRIHNNNNRSKVNVTFPEHKNNDRKITIVFLEENKDEWLHVYFKNDLSSNSKFTLDKNSFWKGGTGNIYIDFGEGYECPEGICASELKNVGYARLDTDPIRSTRLKFIEQNVNLDPPYEFRIIASSIKERTKNIAGISIGCSLIVGAIFSLFSIFIAIKQEKNKNGK